MRTLTDDRLLIDGKGPFPDPDPDGCGYGKVILHIYAS